MTCSAVSAIKLQVSWQLVGYQHYTQNCGLLVCDVAAGASLSMVQRYWKCVVRLAYLYNLCSHVLANTMYVLHVLLHRSIDQAQVPLSTNATTNT